MTLVVFCLAWQSILARGHLQLIPRDTELWTVAL